jgi:ribosomal protein L11 methyltransferase
MSHTATNSHSMLEVRIQCPPVLASYLEELLWTLDGVESVTEHYQSNPAHDETQPSDLSAISLLTRNPLGEDLVKVLLVENPKLLKVCDITGSRWIEEKDWAENWKQYWRPTQVTEKVTVCPTWETYQPRSNNEIVIMLDPECAFGSGTHETTQLMMKALERLSAELDFSQINVLDVGTGSGILAIYAAKLGCKEVRGVDNDPLAVATAVKNARLNHVDSVSDFTDTPLAELCRTQYDVVLANIIAQVILDLFDDILLRLKPGGRFVASGLIEKSVGLVESKMKESGLTDIQRFRQGDWFALSGIYAGK